MDIFRFREYCLSFEGVEEKTPFGKFAARFDSVLVFYVCGHMFCFFDMDNFTTVTVKGHPERIATLHETRASCSSPRNMSPKYWIELTLGGDISDTEILDMIKNSYEIVRAQYSRQKTAK
ncbi:MAG: MmcQ/YjbR family DNA-binding protein [Muribaculaceae bacterium]|nr:MmcQ/YjbR family DNA-binding protein [Muribaculaceae bacterium]